MGEWKKVNTNGASGLLTELADSLRKLAILYVEQESRRIQAMARAVQATDYRPQRHCRL